MVIQFFLGMAIGSCGALAATAIFLLLCIAGWMNDGSH